MESEQLFIKNENVTTSNPQLMNPIESEVNEPIKVPPQQSQVDNDSLRPELQQDLINSKTTRPTPQQIQVNESLMPVPQQKQINNEPVRSAQQQHNVNAESVNLVLQQSQVNDKPAKPEPQQSQVNDDHSRKLLPQQNRINNELIVPMAQQNQSNIEPFGQVQQQSQLNVKPQQDKVNNEPSTHPPQQIHVNVEPMMLVPQQNQVNDEPANPKPTSQESQGSGETIRLAPQRSEVNDEPSNPPPQQIQENDEPMKLVPQQNFAFDEGAKPIPQASQDNSEHFMSAPQQSQVDIEPYKCPLQQIQGNDNPIKLVPQQNQFIDEPAKPSLQQSKVNDIPAEAAPQQNEVNEDHNMQLVPQQKQIYDEHIIPMPQQSETNNEPSRPVPQQSQVNNKLAKPEPQQDQVNEEPIKLVPQQSLINDKNVKPVPQQSQTNDELNRQMQIQLNDEPIKPTPQQIPTIGRQLNPPSKRNHNDDETMKSFTKRPKLNDCIQPNDCKIEMDFSETTLLRESVPCVHNQHNNENYNSTKLQSIFGTPYNSNKIHLSYLPPFLDSFRKVKNFLFKNTPVMSHEQVMIIFKNVTRQGRPLKCLVGFESVQLCTSVVQSLQHIVKTSTNDLRFLRIWHNPNVKITSQFIPGRKIPQYDYTFRKKGKGDYAEDSGLNVVQDVGTPAPSTSTKPMEVTTLPNKVSDMLDNKDKPPGGTPRFYVKMFVKQKIDKFETYGFSTDFFNSLGIKPPLNCNVIIKNLDTSDVNPDADKIRRLFSHAGNVQEVTIFNRLPTSSARVRYDHPLEAVQAVSMFHNQIFYDKKMIVTMSENPQIVYPIGLQSVGRGLGPNGEPLRGLRLYPAINDIKRSIEEIKNELEELKSKVNNEQANPPSQNHPNLLLGLSSLLNQTLLQQGSVNNLTALAGIQNPNATPAETNANYQQNVPKFSPNLAANVQMEQNVLNLRHDSSNMGQNAQLMSQNAQLMGQNVPYMNQHSLNMGHNASYMNQNTPNIVQNAPNMVQNSPNVGSNTPNMGQNASYMNQNMANIVQNTPNVVQNSPNISSNTPNMVQNASYMSQNAPSFSIAPQNMAQSAQNTPVWGQNQPLQEPNNSNQDFTSYSPRPLFSASPVYYGAGNTPQTSQKPNQNVPSYIQDSSQHTNTAPPKLTPQNQYSKQEVAFIKKLASRRNETKGKTAKDGHREVKPSDMLLFSNLPSSVTAQALNEKMREVGEIVFGETTGMGRAVVRFKQSSDAERCIKLFHHSKVDGCVIEVKYF